MTDTMTPEPSTEDGARTDADPLRRGVALGAAAFVAGCLFAALASHGDVVASSTPAWKEAGWYFYSAHFVDLTTSVDAGAIADSVPVDVGTRTSSTNLVDAADSTLGLPYLVPPTLLAAGGGLLTRSLNTTGDAAHATKTGALVIAGYLPLVLVGVFLLEHITTTALFGTEISTRYAVAPAPALLLAGIIYPLLFGGLGGAAASALDDV